jgi:predicted AlkP superfamily phosphohydrolase/phosphomutase
MSINEEYDETIQDLIDLVDQEIGKHYDVNFIAGLERAKEIIKDYFGLID